MLGAIVSPTKPVGVAELPTLMVVLKTTIRAGAGRQKIAVLTLVANV